MPLKRSRKRRWDLNRTTHELLVQADDLNLLEGNKDTTIKTETLIDDCKEVGLGGNAEKTKCYVAVLSPECR
jgi:hypothetical protein